MLDRRTLVQTIALGATGAAGYYAGKQRIIQETTGYNLSRYQGTTESNPWGSIPISVKIIETHPPDYDTHRAVRSALDYWEENAMEYTPHVVEYEIWEDGFTDMQIEFVKRVSSSCHDTGWVDAAGCAPLITDEPPMQTVVEIADVPGLGVAVEVIKHEVGHTLGLDHDDEPQSIMKPVAG